MRTGVHWVTAALAFRFSKTNLCNDRTRMASRLFILSVALMALVVLAPSRLLGQKQYPDQRYYQGAPEYFEADYDDALRFFTRTSRTAFRVGNRRFVDSVCHWTMMAECHYHMGNYAQAITLYEQALQLYLSHENQNWQGRVQAPPRIQNDLAAVNRARITWGTSTRLGGVARVPDTFQVLFGKLENERVLQQGGVVQNPELKRVDVTEVMRCVALCLHRRRVIKGPIAKLDPLTAQLVSGLSVSRAGDGSLLGAYNGVVTGIALAATEDWEAAAAILKRSVKMAGNLDHPLTAIGLLESAYIAQASQQESLAGILALEASYSAAVFGQFDLIEEALSLGTTLHLKSEKTVYPPLVNVIEWARRNDARLLQASMIVRLAECHSELGDPAASNAILSNIGQAIRPRNTLAAAVVSARLKYVTALNRFLTGNFVKGMSSLNGALQHFQKGSLWLYRLRLAESLLASGTLNALQADQLYTVLLHDPTDEEWLTDPFESIAFLASPHTASLERWFEIVIQRRDYRRAVEIGEMLRRHRFFSSLPLGGRLMSFRWGIEAPEIAVTKSAMTKRAEFLNSNPIYRKASDESKRLRNELTQMDLLPESKSDDDRKQNDLLKKLVTVSSIQENILASRALSRVPSELVFPPKQKLNDLRSTLRDDQAAYFTMATFNGYHQFLITKGTVRYLGFIKLKIFHRAMATWLKQLGVNEPSVDIDKLNEDDWKISSRELVGLLFPESTPEDFAKINELLIIPDGAFWYLPFEALLIGEEDNERFLSEFVHVRYAPTLALGIGAQRKTNEGNRLAVVTSQIHSRVDEDLTNQAFEKLAQNVPDAKRVSLIRKSTNAFGGLVDSLVVWSQIRTNRGQPFRLAPMQLGSDRYDGTLAAWMSLPWFGPEQIVMPTFQADGITMKGKTVGHEMFLTATAMMASGSRTVLISRWNTGGATCLNLTREFIETQKKEGIAKALSKSRQSVRDSVLDPEHEPKLRWKASNPETKANHPFFWAGHMLLQVPDERSQSLVPIIDPGKSDDNEKVDDDGEDGGKPEEKPEEKKQEEDDKKIMLPDEKMPDDKKTELQPPKAKTENSGEANKKEEAKPPQKKSGVGWQPRSGKKTGNQGGKPDKGG